MTVFNFKDYRVFLRHYIKNLPLKGRGQIGKMAEHLRVNSTLVSQVLGGSKDFTIEQALSLTKYLGLREIDADFFLLLVQSERAATQDLKDHYRKKIESAYPASLDLKNRIETDRMLSDQERAIFYSSWLYSAVRIFCSLGQGKTIDEVCERFALERDRALSILKFLDQTGLCKQEGSTYHVGAQKTHLEQGSPFLARHYANWRIKALQRSEYLKPDELMFTAPFSIHKEDFAILREEFLTVIQKLYERVGETKPQDLACVNIDLFWIR